MRLRLISDIHLDGREGWKLPKLPDEALQVLCIAGDIGTADRSYRWFFKDVSKRFHKVFLVLGNHDFYGGSLYTAYEQWRNQLLEFDNVTILNNTFELFEDVYFFGTTLWTDFHNDPIAQATAIGYMADYRLIIGYQGNRVYPVEIEEQNRIATDFVKLAAMHPGKRKVLITHHMPHKRFTNERWLKAGGNEYFYTSNLSVEILRMFDLIHCGHTHDAKDFHIRNTRCIVNPLGYGGEYTPYTCDPKLTVDI